MRAEAPVPVLAPQLTAMTLLLRPMGSIGVRPAILILATLAVLTPRVLVSPVTWFALAALVAARMVSDWPLLDNYVYLLAYWCLAIALALGDPNAAAALTTSGQLLLGLALTMAVVWKAALSPDYLDWRFFRVTLLTDDRLADAVGLLGGITRADLTYTRERLAALPEGAELLDPPPLVEPPAFRRLVWLSTVGALVMEALVAVALRRLAGREINGDRACPASLVLPWGVPVHVYPTRPARRVCGRLVSRARLFGSPMGRCAPRPRWKTDVSGAPARHRKGRGS
jgi:hypothetical protein